MTFLMEGQVVTLPYDTDALFAVDSSAGVWPSVTSSVGWRNSQLLIDFSHIRHWFIRNDCQCLNDSA